MVRYRYVFRRLSPCHNNVQFYVVRTNMGITTLRRWKVIMVRRGNEYGPVQVNMQRKAIFQLILEKRELLESQRFRRNAPGRKERKVASHFEITKDSVQKVGTEGVIKGWTEEVLNMSRAVHYNSETGTFKVERSGVYFLYCQVHFNENQSQYVKLEVSVPKGPLLQCMEGYGTTPASGSHKFHFLKPCQVSGLLRLNKGAELKAVTGRSFSLQESGKHYFGLFRVN
ncbi:tumor necrosis factor ligand superfamily member 12 isoform X2 [Triplophysa dalaica]|uniref:tumor necrosis factor ligand superfamily member 12 isoform X2 n=1 Tax=Triplophysa dalaica TaxID=1582913 RepID=UPI0024DF833C|nr:tumor necrosis factor ligand superfamily member 12 isoform X2 [Triplophysa dalaica]